MNRKKYVENLLLLALVAAALGGWLLHLRVHQPAYNPSNYLPLLSGFLSVVLIPLLFRFDSTVEYAYVLNGMTVIIGTITMAHYSVVNFAPGGGIRGILLGTTFADIALLWTKFFIGRALFEIRRFSTDKDTIADDRYFRYPNTGWWLVHLVLMGFVYFLGNRFWK